MDSDEWDDDSLDGILATLPTGGRESCCFCNSTSREIAWLYLVPFLTDRLLATVPTRKVLKLLGIKKVNGMMVSGEQHITGTLIFPIFSTQNTRYQVRAKSLIKFCEKL